MKCIWLSFKMKILGRLFWFKISTIFKTFLYRSKHSVLFIFETQLKVPVLDFWGVPDVMEDHEAEVVPVRPVNHVRAGG